MAVNLEELITQGCKRLKRIPESISNLTRLTKIDVSYCDDLNSYHITIRELTGRCRQIALYFSGGEIEMESIENLSIGENIHILWLDGKADHLCFSTEQKAPDELTKREQQQAPYDKQMYRGLGLPMSEPHGLEWMMQRDRRVPHVHTMPKLHDYESMKKAERKSRATSEFHGFNSIEIIRFNYKSDGASFFCCSLSMFPCLKELNLINLNIQVIPDDVCALKSLEKLDWSGNDFETLPETMNQLPRLKHLETVKLSGCKNLQSLFKTSHAEKDWGRWRLREIWIDDCSIQSVSDQLGHFIKLSYVDLSSNDFETLPSSIRDLSSLRTLCLNTCKKLKSIEGFSIGPHVSLRTRM
ncbi:hypothetical protein Bca4012_027784 [Brassica carinata]